MDLRFPGFRNQISVRNGVRLIQAVELSWVDLDLASQMSHSEL